jgi:pimeloyl-ACP methyl ester carboxylesterase
VNREAGGTDVPSPDVFIHVDGRRLFVRVWEGDWLSQNRIPIVLLHDSLGSVDLWRDFPAALAASTGRPVVAYDRLGFGRSDPHPGALEGDFIRHEGRITIPTLRETLAIDRVILFGHSVGGGMAIAAAAEPGDAVVAVISESAQTFAEAQTLAGVREAKDAFESPVQFERLARYHGNKARWVLSSWTDTWLSPAFADWTLDEDIRAVRCPVLAIHGDHDEFGSRAHPDRIAALSPAPARVVILDDCGHVPHREQPDVVLREVAAFVEAHCGA